MIIRLFARFYVYGITSGIFGIPLGQETRSQQDVPTEFGARFAGSGCKFVPVLAEFFRDCQAGEWNAYLPDVLVCELGFLSDLHFENRLKAHESSGGDIM